MAKTSNEQDAMTAIDRIVNRLAQIAPDDRLIDSNLVLESGISRATVYRCNTAMVRWRKEKELSVEKAIRQLSSDRLLRPSQELRDQDLVRIARVDHAALRKMPPALIAEWEELKAKQPGRAQRQYDQLSADDVIKTLVNKLYATTLVIRQLNDTIAAQAATIVRLGGNVVPLPRPEEAAS